MKNERDEMLSSKEVSEIKELERIGNIALKKAHEVHDELGASGVETLEKNQFGDTALRGDVEAEKAVLGVLKEYNVPIKVISEEHGTTIIGDKPLYLGILDGIDGSGVYKNERGKGRYATMFGIFNTINPNFENYLYAGIIEHSSNRLYFASKRNGTWIKDNQIIKQIQCSQSTQLGENQTRLYADTNFDEVYGAHVISNLLKGLEGFNISCAKSSAIHYADLAKGRVDGVIECTRKGNLEIAVAYPIIIEAGGIMVDTKGESLGNKKYSEFGQREHTGVISACTQDLATALVQKINSV